MRTAPVLCLLSLTAPLAAQYVTGFESPTFTASSSGTPTAGQDGFYLPPVAGSFDGAIFDYATNTLGVPINPNGGANFYGGNNVSGLVRAQRSLTVPSNSRCTMQFDFLCNYLSTVVPAAQYLGGFSLQPSAVITPQFPTAAVYSNLVFAFVDTNVPTSGFNIMGAYGPTLASTITLIPDPAFQNLAFNRWYTLRIVIDLRTKEYFSWAITDSLTSITTTYTPGVPVPLPNQAATYMPTDFRLFTGGGAGNMMAFDNVAITYGATFDPFGAGCAGAMGVPTLTAGPGSAPAIGTTFNVDVGNLPLSLAIMLTGLSNTLAFGSIPLPYSLAGSGFPGCDLLVDPLVTQFLIGGSNSATWPFAVPNSISFAGLELFNQAASVDTGPAGLAFSNGGRSVIGL